VFGVAVGSEFGVVIVSTLSTMRVTLGDTAVAGIGVALSVARKVTVLPAITVGAVGVPVTWLPTIWRPCGREPEFTE
jgi:hypothetical protein